jgi:hypothetical protein
MFFPKLFILRAVNELKVKNMKKIITIIVITSVIVGSGAFYGGMKYSQSKSTADRQARFQQLGDQQGTAFAGGAGAGRMQRAGGGFVAGEILSKDDKSLTVKLQDGGSKIVLFTPSTPISKSTAGLLTDLNIGSSVSITGTPNQDGSVTAQSIQLRPANIKIK